MKTGFDGLRIVRLGGASWPDLYMKWSPANGSHPRIICKQHYLTLTTALSQKEGRSMAANMSVKFCLSYVSLSYLPTRESFMDRYMTIKT